MSSPIIRFDHRRVYGVLAVLAATVVAACDSSDPVAVRSETAVVEGRVASVGSASTAPAAASGISLLAGIEVSVEGSNAATTTDASGNFRLEVEVDGTEPIVLRFRTALLDVLIEVDGVTPGSTVRLAVSLSAQGGTIIDRDDGRHEGFEGVATFVSITGEAPSRTLRVQLVSATRTSHVDIVEGETVFDAEGDVLSFAALLVALDRADLTVRMGGDGMVQDGGATLSTFVKVETDEPDGSSDDGSGSGSGGDAMGQLEFRGSAVLVSTVGTAPTRT